MPLFCLDNLHKQVITINYTNVEYIKLETVKIILKKILPNLLNKHIVTVCSGQHKTVSRSNVLSYCFWSDSGLKACVTHPPPLAQGNGLMLR